MRSAADRKLSRSAPSIAIVAEIAVAVRGDMATSAFAMSSRCSLNSMPPL